MIYNILQASMIGTNNKGVDTYGIQVYEDKEGSDTPNHFSNLSLSDIWVCDYE